MPNHCYNGLRITGNPTRIREIAEKHFPMSEDKGERKFDFNTVIPYPQEYKDMDEAYRKACTEAGTMFISGMKDGYNSGGYDWCNKNWSTKWNAYDQSVEYYDEFDDEDTNYIQAEFYTAWAPPEGIYRKLVELYPDVDIYASYEEAGMQYEGTFQNVDGELVDNFIAHSKRILRGG